MHSQILIFGIKTFNVNKLQLKIAVEDFIRVR